ncbi:MAG: hypothetical protein GXO43_06890 [Crenarchaeota archaeon]|nr:hypothetical protein [Thermoproteota archaeon]
MGLAEKIRWLLLPSWAKRLINTWKNMEAVVDVKYNYHNGVLDIEVTTCSGKKIRDRCTGRGIMVICSSRVEQVAELW